MLPFFVNPLLITSFISLIRIGVLPYALFAEVFFSIMFFLRQIEKESYFSAN